MAGVLPGCGALSLPALIPGGDSGEPWSRTRLKTADTLARRQGGKGWAAWNGRSQATSWNTSEKGQILSITKSLAGLAATRASQEGWLSPGDLAADTLKEWQKDPRKRRITVLMLLQQTAGLDPSSSALYHGTIGDKGSIAVSRPVVDEPGTRFRYGPVCWEVLAELMHRKLQARGETLERFLQRAVMRPIGLSSPNWRSDKKGRFYLSTGAELSVDELGRLGRTLGRLLKGESADGFDAAHYAAMSRTSGPNRMFGAGVWRNINRSSPRSAEIEVEDSLNGPLNPGFWQQACLSKVQPASMAALIGSSGRRVFLWPEQNRTVARLGVSSAWQDRPFLNSLT